MKNKLANLSLLAALALLAGTAGNAQANPGNFWTNVGTSVGGGYIIIGNSAPTDLGSLDGNTSPVFLSAGGSDIITLNAGNTATSGNHVIEITTSNNILNNFGLITGTGVSSEGVEVYGNSNTVNNSGTITSVDYSVDIEGNKNVFNNTGLVSASSEYDIYLTGTGNVINNHGTLQSPYDPFWEEGGSHNTLNNWGSILSTGAGGKYGVYSEGSFFTLNNWGLISVEGSGHQAVYSSGDNFTFNNHGQVTSAGDGADLYGNNSIVNNFADGSINAAYYGIYVDGTSIAINNWGSIIVSGDYAVYFDAPNGTLNNYRGGMISSASDYTVYIANDNITVNNQGTISGAGDYTIYNYGYSNFVLNNYRGGIITGAYLTVYNDGPNGTVNNWGSITNPTGDYAVGSDGDYFTLNNWGTISAAFLPVYGDGAYNTVNNWGLITCPGDYAVWTEVDNFTLNNWGTISAATDVVYDDGGSNTLINNWGTIAATGAGPAIYVSGNNNTINLNGHSSVIGKITVTGVNNVVNLNFTGLNRYELGMLRNSLIAQGANSGTATNVQFTLRKVNYNIDPAIVNVNLTSYQAQAITPNQAAIGANLDSLVSNPAPGTPLFNMLNAIDASGNVPQALNQFSPQKFQIFGDIAFANANFNSLQIDQRLNNLRDGSESIDTTGIGGDTTTTAGFDKDGKDSKGVIQTKSEERRWGFFASGDVLHANVDARDGLQNAKFTTAGLVLGVDGKVNENWVLGALFSYQRTSSDLDSQGSTANIDSFGGGVYTGYHNGGWYGNGLATYTRNNYDTSRIVAFPGFGTGLTGSTNGNQFGVNLDGGYDFNLNQSWTAGPLLGLQYTHLGVDGFTESGATAANLALGSQDVDSLRSRLGFRLAYHKQIGKEVGFAAEARAAWQHEFLDDSRGISASFAGSGLAPFSVKTTSPERDAALLGLGVNLTVRNRMTIFADYDVQVGQQSYFEQSVRGGLKFSW